MTVEILGTSSDQSTRVEKKGNLLQNKVIFRFCVYFNRVVLSFVLISRQILRADADYIVIALLVLQEVYLQHHILLP